MRILVCNRQQISTICENLIGEYTDLGLNNKLTIHKSLLFVKIRPYLTFNLLAGFHIGFHF